MPIDVNTVDNGLTAGIGATHELDEAVISSAKKRMVVVAEPLLKSIFVAKEAAERNIAKRQAFVDGAATLAQRVRAAYDAGNEKALGEVQAELTKYSNSLLRAKKSR